MTMMDKAHWLYALSDAEGDMLTGLNKLTDLECPSFMQVKMMGILSKAVKDLQEAKKFVAEMDEDMTEAEAMNGHAKVK